MSLNVTMEKRVFLMINDATVLGTARIRQIKPIVVDIYIDSIITAVEVHQF